MKTYIPDPEFRRVTRSAKMTSTNTSTNTTVTTTSSGASIMGPSVGSTTGTTTTTTTATGTATTAGASAAPTPSNQDTFTSQEHREFASEPMRGKDVTKLPGIGDKLGETLRNKGFTKATDVREQFLYLERTGGDFKEWLKKDIGANEKHCEDCYRFVKDWTPEDASLSKAGSSSVIPTFTTTSTSGGLGSTAAVSTSFPSHSSQSSVVDSLETPATTVRKSTERKKKKVSNDDVTEAQFEVLQLQKEKLVVQIKNIELKNKKLERELADN